MKEINWYLPKHCYQTREAHEYMRRAKDAKEQGFNGEYVGELVKTAKALHTDGMTFPREHRGLR